jgi:hypothetical protein
MKLGIFNTTAAMFREGEGQPHGSGLPAPAAPAMPINPANPNPVNLMPTAIITAPAPTPVPPAPVVPPAPPVAETVQPAPDGTRRVVTISTEQLNDRLKRASEVAAKKEREQLDAEARELGFADDKSMKAYVKNLNLRAEPAPEADAEEPKPGKKPAVAPKPAAPAADASKLTDRQLKAWEAERATLAAEKAALERSNAKLRRQIDAKDTELHLREAARTAGIEDIDIALSIYERAVQNLTEEQLKTFDEVTFFKGQKKDRPYLFKADLVVPVVPITVPLTTGPGADNPPAPAPGPAAQAQADAGRFDARKATQAQLNARLKQLGVTPPT